MKRLQHHNRLLPKPVRVLQSWSEAPNNIFLELDLDSRHSLPGQFIQIGLPGVGEAPISIASHNKSLLLNINVVGRVTKALSMLKKGDVVFVRGPLGKGYPLQLLEGNNLLLIAGGCGVAPMSAVLDYVQLKRSAFKSIKCFFGFRSPKHVLFRNRILSWANISDLTISVDTDIDKKHQAHLGDIERFINFEGFVTQALDKENISNENIVAFICGPPIMMKFVVKVLKSKNFKDNQLFLSMERLMYCGRGYCCHCMINDLFTCIDGPVFRYDVLKTRPESMV